MPDCGEAPAGETPTAVGGFASFGLTLAVLPGRGFANRTPTEPAGEKQARPALTWFALGK